MHCGVQGVPVCLSVWSASLWIYSLPGLRGQDFPPNVSRHQGGYPHEYPHDILVMVDSGSQLSIMIPVFQGIVGEPSLSIYL